MSSAISSKGVIAACKPRKEVLEGELDDAIFAADFGDVIDGTAPEVYNDARTFFRNTEPTPHLVNVCTRVFRALEDTKEGGQLVRLSTGYGGGKTHTLIAFWHLAKNISNPSMGGELLQSSSSLKRVTVVGIDASKAGIPVFKTHDKTSVNSIQGELFWCMGEAPALEMLGGADSNEACPEEALITKVLGSGPLLILIDELVIYMAGLSASGQGNLMGFIGKLISAVKKRPQTVLVITDPGQQPSYADISAKLAEAIVPAAVKIEDIMGRKMTDYDPIGEQAARVIARRLFESIDSNTAAQVANDYQQLFKRVEAEHPDLIPPGVTSTDYAKLIEKCYPFHPRLIETAKERLGALPDFHRSRGVLRLFAKITREIWDQKPSIDLITAGDINWGSESIKGDLLYRLHCDRFAAAVAADVEGHARRLDDGQMRGIHYRVASALLLESLPQNDRSGLDPAELTLAILQTYEAGQEPSEALDRLVGACWHTYPMAGGRGWQFRVEPNVIKQIEQRAASVNLHDAQDRVFSEVQSYFNGPLFTLSSWPGKPKDVLERKDIQLVLCADVELAEQVTQYADTSNPSAPVPRRYRNAIVAVAPSPDAFNMAVERGKRLIAAEQIEKDVKTGENNAMAREQLKRIKPNLMREFKIQTCRAFDTIVRADGVAGRLEETYLVDKEILSSPQGQKYVMAFLQDKKMIYNSGESLDPDRFMQKLLSGATPVPDKPDVFRLSEVHARFLATPGLRLIPDASVVRRTIINAVDKGRVVLHLADGSVYDAKGSVVGKEGQRRRQEGVRPPSLNLKDDELITRADSTIALSWLKVDPLQTPMEGTQQIEVQKPIPPDRVVVATNWEAVKGHAENRPLIEFVLDADAPAIAETLPALIQPMSADKIALDVTISGQLKSGGNVNFEVNGVQLNSPIKPLESAKMLYNAMVDGATYGARVVLTFKDPGRFYMASALETASDKADDKIKVEAKFGKMRDTK